jgi:3-oxoacyl-[acyl-carrier protein] reductase
MDFKGKVAIVTGGSQGIGRAYVLALAQAGATVVATARSYGAGTGEIKKGTLAEVIHTGTGLPGRIVGLACDVENEANTLHLANFTAANFGRIDVLVNNAAIYTHHDALDMRAEDWDQAMNTNVRGPWFAMRAVAPHMMRQKSGSIINLTSLAALPTTKGAASHDGLMAYGVTKAALNRLTTFFAAELAPHGIAVNALSPGGVLTDTWAKNDPAAYAEAERSGHGKRPLPEVMGPAMLHLAAQSASGITGQILHTDQFGKTWPKP